LPRGTPHRVTPPPRTDGASIEAVEQDAALTDDEVTI